MAIIIEGKLSKLNISITILSVVYAIKSMKNQK